MLALLHMLNAVIAAGIHLPGMIWLMQALGSRTGALGGSRRGAL